MSAISDEMLARALEQLKWVRQHKPEYWAQLQTMRLDKAIRILRRPDLGCGCVGGPWCCRNTFAAAVYMAILMERLTARMHRVLAKQMEVNGNVEQ